MQARAADDLKRLVGDGLKAAGLDFTERASLRHAAPPGAGGRGPADGAGRRQRGAARARASARPSRRSQGFLKGAGLASLDQAREARHRQGRVLVRRASTKKGGPTAEVAAGHHRRGDEALPWPKSMRWGGGTMRWVRPLQSIVALFDGEVLAGEVALGGAMAPIGSATPRAAIASSARATFEVADFADYAAKLRGGARHPRSGRAPGDRSLDGAESSAPRPQGLRCRPTTRPARRGHRPGRMAGAAAGPHRRAVHGRAARGAGHLDARRTRTTSRCAQADGTLAPPLRRRRQHRGRATAARRSSPATSACCARGCRDAKFFWDQDRKRTLEEPRAGARRASSSTPSSARQAERVERIAALAGELAAVRAGRRCRRRSSARRCSAKADLVTGMVGEFPELQGVMGRYYALRRRRAPARGRRHRATTTRPRARTTAARPRRSAIAVALADKLDTLVGFFADRREADRLASDPFALRRAALGVIRIDRRERAAPAAARSSTAAARRLWRSRRRLTPTSCSTSSPTA